MVTIAPEPARAPNGFADEATDASDADFKPMSADEAREWRAAQPPMSPWPVVWVQAGAGLVAVALAWAVSAGKMPVTQSTAYGALAAWLPAVFFARLVARRMRLQANAGSA